MGHNTQRKHNMKNDTKITALVALMSDRDKCRAQWHWAKVSQSIDGVTRRELMNYWRDRYIRIRKAKAEISTLF